MPNYPKIVWVRVGNCSKQKLLEIFKKHWDTIKQELEAGTFLVEVIFAYTHIAAKTGRCSYCCDVLL